MIDPFESGDQNAETLRLLRQVGNSRDELGEKLARHEFLSLQRELRSEHAFRLDIDFGTAVVEAPGSNPDLSISKKGLPILPVPLGSIAWVANASSMPVIGILVEDAPNQELAGRLLGLLSEHHRAPFAKLFFICRDYTPVPLLGRYGFACHVSEEQNLDLVGRGLHKRFGVQQIRSLRTQAQIWSA